MSILSVAKGFASTVKKSDPEVEEQRPIVVKPAAPIEFAKPVQLQPSSWTREDEILIDWFLSATILPEAPFQLNGGVKVLDPQKYYAALRNDIEQGPKGPRARYGALQGELLILKRLVESGGSI